ncbi:MAG: hypothetical protein E7419_04450 [Ruminococcaceae bacterium]|nr:hypothetical protein [Oscillospiraceae bacterium]
MNGNGKIIARVTLASESVPVKDAIVTASTNVDDKQILLGTRRTDENGKTTPIDVETPDIEYSLEPENSVKPYTSVDVRVDHPSAYSVLIRNVQVFSDNTSLVNVSLIPLREGIDEGTQEIIEITSQNL